MYFEHSQTVLLGDFEDFGNLHAFFIPGNVLRCWFFFENTKSVYTIRFKEFPKEFRKLFRKEFNPGYEEALWARMSKFSVNK